MTVIKARGLTTAMFWIVLLGAIVAWIGWLATTHLLRRTLQ